MFSVGSFFGRRRGGGGGGGAILAKPTVTNVSAAGAAPLVLSLSDADYVAGKYLQWEFAASLTPAKNANGSYITTSQSGVAFIDGDSWSRLDQALGYNTPNGVFAFHCRVLQENQSGSVTVTDQLGNTFNADASAWSTDYADTIVVSTATLTSTLGNSKSQYETVNSPFFQAIMNNNTGVLSGVRATAAAVNTKFHCEVTATSFQGAGGNSNFYCGFDDNTLNFNISGTGVPTGSQPGRNGGAYPGMTMIGVKGQSAVTFVHSGNDGVSLTLPNALTDADTFAFDIDTVAHTVLITYYHAGTPTVLNGGAAITLTAMIPSSFWSFVGGGVGSGTAGAGVSDAATANFGASSWLVTPQTGYSIYA